MATFSLEHCAQALTTQLLSLSKEIILTIDRYECVLFYNNTAEQIFGWENQKIQGKNISRLCESNNIRFSLLTKEHDFTQQQIISEESILEFPDGRRYTILWQMTPFHDSHNQWQGFLIVGHDLTRVRQLEREVYQLDSIIKYAPDMIYWKDRNSVHLGCNDRFAEVAGLKSREDVVGKTDYDFAWHSQAESYRRDDYEVVTAGKPKSNIEDTMPQSGGRIAMVMTNKVPLCDEEGSVIGVLGIATDITELVRTRAALTEAKERAEAANRAKSEFLAIMSHELRTPLNAILGMAQILQMQTLESEKLSYIDVIYNSGANLLGLINDILDFTKLNAGKLRFVKSPVCLARLVEQHVENLRHLATERGLSLHLNIAATLPEEILGDSGRIRQVLTNLINNAIKFTLKGDIHIDVHCLEKTERSALIRISVRDTGIGIPADKLDQIFERFTQLRPSYYGKRDGVGLGLAITKQLVEIMGGTIRVESTLGAGSLFICEIPFPLSSSEDISFGDMEEVLISANQTRGELLLEKEKIGLYLNEKTRILLVEDNPVNQIVLTELLKDYHCQVDLAEDGHSAIAKIDSQTAYEIILLDVGLPDISGIEVARHIRHQEKSLNKAPCLIIAVTAHVMDEDRNQCFAAGVDEVITKPIHIAQLANALGHQSKSAE